MRCGAKPFDVVCFKTSCFAMLSFLLVQLLPLHDYIMAQPCECYPGGGRYTEAGCFTDCRWCGLFPFGPPAACHFGQFFVLLGQILLSD
jgi:hypothetical protein